MKETRYKYNPAVPYSLHDMRIHKICVHNASVIFHFEDGYTKMVEPYSKVKGDIEIQGVDVDFCCVHILSRFGRYGGFRGEKMELADFISRYNEFSFEVVDELYGYNQVEYSGYLSLPGSTVLREMDISLYFTGDIIYRAEE